MTYTLAQLLHLDDNYATIRTTTRISITNSHPGLNAQFSNNISYYTEMLVHFFNYWYYSF